MLKNAQNSLIRFNKQTAKGLEDYLQDCRNRAFSLNRELKAEFHYSLTPSRANIICTHDICIGVIKKLLVSTVNTKKEPYSHQDYGNSNPKVGMYVNIGRINDTYSD